MGETLPFDTINRITTAYLGIAGTIYIAIGLSWIFQPAGGTRTEGLEWIEGIEPWMVGVAWVVAGALAVAGWARRTLAQLGFSALIATPATIGLWFLISWVWWLSPVHGGAERGAVTAVSYTAFTASAYAISRIYILTHRRSDE